MNNTATPQRHLHIYAQLMLSQTKINGRRVRLEWADIPTASIAPDPTGSADLVLSVTRMAADGTEEDATLLAALISHEIVCHGLHSSFGVLESIQNGTYLVLSAYPKLAAALVNAVEDPRGELLGAKPFPGSKKVIHKGLEILVKRGIFSGPQGDHPASILLGWLVTHLRSQHLQQSCLSELSCAYEDAAIAIFGCQLIEELRELAVTAIHSPTTAAAADVVAQMIGLIESFLEVEEEQEQGQGQQNGEGSADGAKTPRSPQGERGEGGTEKSAQNVGTDSSCDTPGEQGTGEAEEAETPGESQPADSGKPAAQYHQDQLGRQVTTSNGASSDGTHERAISAAAKDSIRTLLEATEEQFGVYGSGLEDVLARNNQAAVRGASRAERQLAETIGEERSKGPADHLQAQRLRLGARRVASELSQTLEEALKAETDEGTKRGYHGTLHRASVCKALAGDLRVFDATHRIEKISTCMHVLVDRSSSMKETFEQPRSAKLSKICRMDAASFTAVALADVLSTSDIPFGISLYDHLLTEVKTFDGNWESEIKRFDPKPRGSTLTHLAVANCLSHFIGRREDRKILQVITDGDPGNTALLQLVLQEAKALGVEVNFVLIGHDYEFQFQETGANYVAASNPDELARAVFSSLIKVH